MRVITSDMDLYEEHFKNSIFLAGPTPRAESVKSWRPEAIKILKQIGFKGNVLIPERDSWQMEYLDQVEWEDDALGNATSILFWVPRNMATMPALTTNVEFGRWIVKRGDRVVYGRPNDAVHCRYLDWLYDKELHKTPLTTLVDTIRHALP